MKANYGISPEDAISTPEDGFESLLWISVEGLWLINFNEPASLLCKRTNACDLFSSGSLN
jgi:hypothetical protein